MSFLRRNKDATANNAQATPVNPTTPAVASPKSKEKAGGGIKQWVIDSYNGLYKIVLEPSMPTKATVMLVIFGLVVGLLWAYAIQPVEFTGANPHRLNQDAQDQWIKMVAANFDRGFYAEEQAIDLLSRVDNPTQAIQRMLNDPGLSVPDREALQSIGFLAQGIGGTPTPVAPGFFGELLNGWLLPIILLVIIIPIFTLLWRLLIFPNLVAPLLQRARMAVNKDYRAQIQKQRDEIKIQQEQRRLASEMAKLSSVDEELGEPIMKRASIFQEGRSYDDSFEIELPLDKGGDFLGQCGSVVAEATSPDPVAVEVWLFDMLSQQNLKRIFITPEANNDPTTRRRVEQDVDNPATDIIVATPGSVATINSDKLRLQAKLITVESNPDGRFKSFQMQLQAWQKDGRAGAVPTGASGFAAPPPIPPAQPLPDYSDMTFDPPPMPPSAPSPQPPGFGTPAPSGIQPLQPPQGQPMSPPPMSPPQSPPPQSPPPQSPPMSPPQGGQFGQPPQPQYPPQQPPQGQPMSPPSMPYPPPMEEDDDDPFGNTGDFTPLR